MKNITINLSKDELKKKLDILPLDEAPEIRDKLESLNDTDRLDISAIKGLDDYDEISKLARKKVSTTVYQGGGVGQVVRSIVAGSNITVDNTDPQNPIVSSTGGISTFEYYDTNIPSTAVTATSISASKVVKTFASGLISTLNLTAGLPTTKVLSGTLPVGLTITTKHYDFSGGHTVPLVTYS